MKAVPQFNSDGFRVITTKTLTEAEWNFTPLDEANRFSAKVALRYELFRECEQAYQHSADFHRAVMDANFSKMEKLGLYPPQSEWCLPDTLWIMFPIPYLMLPTINPANR